MRWIPDTTSRFPQRPLFDALEIDDRAEKCVGEFLRHHKGAVAYPLATNDLVALIEERTSDLDLYADLSTEGADIEGVTYFAPGGLPSVRVAKALDDTRRENRQRMTLAHELGHVDLHNDLWPAEPPPELFPDTTGPRPVRCLRRTMERRVSRVDWMEWQASYFSSALLVPRQACQALLAATPSRSDRVALVTATFHVSSAAAQVRLDYLATS